MPREICSKCLEIAGEYGGVIELIDTPGNFAPHLTAENMRLVNPVPFEWRPGRRSIWKRNDRLVRLQASGLNDGMWHLPVRNSSRSHGKITARLCQLGVGNVIFDDKSQKFEEWKAQYDVRIAKKRAEKEAMDAEFLRQEEERARIVAAAREQAHQINELGVAAFVAGTTVFIRDPDKLIAVLKRRMIQSQLEGKLAQLHELYESAGRVREQGDEKWAISFEVEAGLIECQIVGAFFADK